MKHSIKTNDEKFALEHAEGEVFHCLHYHSRLDSNLNQKGLPGNNKNERNIEIEEYTKRYCFLDNIQGKTSFHTQKHRETGKSVKRKNIKINVRNIINLCNCEKKA